MYGEVMNNTGEAQELYFITGTFYDAQGQVLPDALTIDYWPIETVPQGGRIPFEVTVLAADNLANFDLSVDAEPSDEYPSQDFEFLEVEADGGDNYCISGKVQNLGGQLAYYLSIVVVLYDSEDKVISFSDHYNHSPEDLVGDQMMDFEICVDPLGQVVAHHEVRAWGL